MQLKNLVKSLVPFVLTVLLGFAFYQLGFKTETILMIFFTGVLIIVIETGSYLFGFVSSILYVFLYNFFFTAPFYTFKIEDINNVVSLIIFFIVSLIAGILAGKLQKQIKLTAMLEKTKAEVENEKNKTMLLRSISHDLRTPLTSIAGSSNFLKENFDTVSKEDAISLLSDIENDARTLTSMVENLLNMTKIQDGRLTIKKEMHVLDDLISEAILHTVKKDCPQKVIIDETSQIVLCKCDGKLIMQVLNNIIDNALKYTPSQSIIKIKTQFLENENSALITITDNGKGIPQNMEEKIFETFYTSSTQGDKTRGLGLGLPICRTIINAHGGSITARNSTEPNFSGASFIIKLPEAKV